MRLAYQVKSLVPVITIQNVIAKKLWKTTVNKTLHSKRTHPPQKKTTLGDLKCLGMVRMSYSKMRHLSWYFYEIRLFLKSRKRDETICGMRLLYNWEVKLMLKAFSILENARAKAGMWNFGIFATLLFVLYLRFDGKDVFNIET